MQQAQKADGGFFESFSALSWKRENRRLKTIREEEVKRENCPPLESSVGVPNPNYQITDDEWQKLYVNVLYTINNNIGSDGNVDVESLYSYSQKVFRVSDDEHRRSIEAAANEQPPVIVLNVTVIEAQGLEAKDPNGFSDPFCMLGIQPTASTTSGIEANEPEDEVDCRLKKHHSFKLSFKRKDSKKCEQSQQQKVESDIPSCSKIPAKYICATSVKPHTLNPQWNEKFTFDIDDIQTEQLHLDIWDNDDESSVLEAVRQLNQVQSWKGLGRYFKQVAQSARSHGGYNVDDFLGCIDINLNDIPSKGVDGWFPLQGRSQRSTVQGDIHLRLRLSAKDRLIPDSDSLYKLKMHEKLLHTFLESEILKQGNNVYQWSGKLPIEAEAILHQHVVQNDLSHLQQAVCRWRAFSQKHMENAFDYSALHQLLQILNQEWNNESLKEEQEELLAESFRQFVGFSLSLLQKKRDLFPPVNKAALHKLEYLLKCLSLINDMQAFWRCCPFHNEIHLEIINVIKKGNVQWYEKMLAHTRPQVKTDDSNIHALIDLVNILNDDLNWCLKYYNKLFDTLMNVDYFVLVYKQVDKLLMDQLKRDWKLKIEEDVKPIVEKLCQQLRENENINEDPLTESLTIGTSMFELYLGLQEFVKFKDNIPKEERQGISTADFHEWFSGALLRWASIARYKAMIRIKKALEFDKVTQVDTGVKLSSSAVDTTTCFYQIKDFWKLLAWSDVATAYPFVFKILDDICNGATYYGELVHNKLQEVNYFDDEGQFDVTDQLCLIINNIEHVRSVLKEIPEEMNMYSILNAIENVEGEVYGHQCRKAVSLMLTSAEEDVEEKINIVVKRVGERMQNDLKKHIFHLAWAPDALSAEKAIVPLMEYLDNNLTTLNHNLLGPNFERILEVIWNLVLEELMTQAKGAIGERQPVFFKRIHDAYTIMLEFFHAEQKGLNVQKLHCELYQQLEEVVQLHSCETSELIKNYFSEKIDEQKNKEKPAFGSLTVKVYYHHESLFIEIIHAKNIIALDPNGYSDPFVIVELHPQAIFPNTPQQQTKVQKKTLNPLFDECFEHSVTLEQCKDGSSIVLFTVMDHDIMLSNDFAGEACLALNTIPGVSSFLPASEIASLQPIELILTRPKFTDSIILTTLEKRVWDKTAQDFAKRRKSRVL